MGTWRIAQYILTQNMYQEEDEQRAGRSIYLSEGGNARVHTYCTLLPARCSICLLARHVHCRHFPRPFLAAFHFGTHTAFGRHSVRLFPRFSFRLGVLKLVSASVTLRREVLLVLSGLMCNDVLFLRFCQRQQPLIWSLLWAWRLPSLIMYNVSVGSGNVTSLYLCVLLL
jgi:hypothetical protein